MSQIQAILIPKTYKSRNTHKQIMKLLKVKNIKPLHETTNFFWYRINKPKCQDDNYSCFIKTIPIKDKKIRVIFQSKKK